MVDLLFDRTQLLPPPGVASDDERRLHWNYVNIVAVIGIIVAYELSKGDTHQKRLVPISRQLQDNTPILIFVAGFTTMAGSILLAPFSNDVYKGKICPCHWTEDFASQYTTLSTMAAYRPMRYIILVGLISTAYLIQVTSFILARRLWPRLKHQEKGKWTVDRFAAAACIVSSFLEPYPLIGLTLFARHVDAKQHVSFAIKFLTCAFLTTTFGHFLMERMAKAEWMDPNEGMRGLNKSRIVTIACYIFGVWYGMVYVKQVLKSEAGLAVSEYLLLLSLLSWPICVAHCCRGEKNPYGWTKQGGLAKEPQKQDMEV